VVFDCSEKHATTDHSASMSAQFGYSASGSHLSLKKGDCADYVQKLLNQANKMFAGGYPHLSGFWEGYDKMTHRYGWGGEKCSALTK
jgi:hypothetical protein